MSVPGLVVPKELESDPEFARELEELDAIFEENALELYNNPLVEEAFSGYRVHRKQLEFNEIKVPPRGTKAIIAGNRTGKTRGGLADDVIQAVRPQFVPEHLKPCKKWEGPIDIWVGAPKYQKHEDTILPTLRKLIPKGELIEQSFGKSYKAQSRILKLGGGSTFTFKTYDQDLDAWASAEVHRVHWDEEPNGENSREMRSEARARLLSTDGDELVTMSPLLGFSWVNDDVWEQRNSNPMVSVVQMGMADNPWLSQEAIKDFERGLTQEEIRMRVHGEFVHLGGMFFEEFRESLHVVEPVPLDHIKDQDIVVGIDPGRNRTGVVWVCFDSDNSALVFDEFFPREAIVPEVAKEILRRNTEWEIKQPTYVIDPTSRNASAINADEVAAAYSRHGIDCEWGQNSRQAGILEMKRRFQDRDSKGRPHPSLLFARNCNQVIKQVERYRRDPKARDEWQAVPQNDQTRFDLVDAVRYSVMSRTYGDGELAEAVKDPPHYDPYEEPPFDASEFLLDPAPLGDMS